MEQSNKTKLKFLYRQLNRIQEEINLHEKLLKQEDRIPEIIYNLSKFTPYDYTQIISKNHNNIDLAMYRAMIWKILKDEFNFKHKVIIKHFFHKNRSTISNGIIKINDLLLFYKDIEEIYNGLKSQVNNV